MNRKAQASSAHSKMDWQLFRIRGRILQLIREFFISRDYIEVDGPLLTPFPTLDSNIDSMCSQYREADRKPIDLYLHTSPEHAMKKLLARGGEKLFFLGKVFRNGELSPHHNPEFTMIEWYQTYSDYRLIQKETQELVQTVARVLLGRYERIHRNLCLDLLEEWKHVTLCELLLSKAGLDLPSHLTLNSLRKFAAKAGIPFAADDDWQTLFFRIYIEKVEPGLGCKTPLFIRNYPEALALMAKPCTVDPAWVERTELYIGGVELANGYTECTERSVMESRFQKEQTFREAKGLRPHRLDNELLDALEHIPPSAGMALGFDRLVMLLLGKSHIRDVLFFPMHSVLRPDVKEPQ